LLLIEIVVFSCLGVQPLSSKKKRGLPLSSKRFWQNPSRKQNKKERREIPHR
jgi:hypothetical protein